MPSTPAPVFPTDAPPPPHRTGVAPLLVLGGGGVALVLTVLVGWLVLRSTGGAPAPSPAPTASTAAVATPEPEAPPPSTAAPVSLSLRVESTPPGAMVTVNGQSQGASPLEMTGLAAGDYEVKVELRGHEARTEKVTLRPEEPHADLKVALTRAAPTTGTADFLSTPFGAVVAVDGTAVGPTPVLQHRLKPGPHKVEMTKEGHEPWSGTFTVEAGKKAKVDASLRAIVVKATPPPAPAADAFDPNRVYNNVPSDVDTLAKRTSGSSPVYPTDQLGKLKSGESASVVVSFQVSEEGEVTDPKVEVSGGSKPLDEVVLSAVRKWKYSPAVKRGTKVKVRITLKQTFQAG